MIVEGDETRIGNGDTKDVAGKVIEHGLRALAPRDDANDPAFDPGWIVRRDQLGPFACQQGAEFAAHKLGEGLVGNEKGVVGWIPVAAVRGNAAAGDEAVNVGVVEKLLRPGVEDCEHTDGAADEATVAGEINDGLGGGLHQQRIAITLVGAQNAAQFLGHGDHNMEVMGCQQFGLAMCKPGLGLVGVTLGAAAIPARVIGKHLMAAMIATPEVPSESLCTASENVGDGAAMRRRHRRAMCLQIVFRKPAKDLGNFDHGGQPKSGAEADHEFVEEICERAAGGLGQMQVESCRGNLAVPEQQLDNADINTVFEKPGRIGVSKTMKCHRTDAGCLGDGRKGPIEGAAPDRVISGPIGEQPARVFVTLPKSPQAPEHRVREWNQPLFVAFANDGEEVIAAVYCRNLKAYRLAGS